MNFNPHWNLKDKHAFLSASQYHWLNYNDEKLAERYFTYQATERGTKLHELAAMHIEMGIFMPRNRSTLNAYVNDAIAFGLTPEQVLYFSDNCFGTADAIGFKKNKLRIHDLKTGVTPASIKQLEIYAALFCLEYDVPPADISIELRLYQNDDMVVENPGGDIILPIMDRIRRFDKIIEDLKKEG